MFDADMADCRALVVDGSLNSRTIIAGQLRDLGVTQVTQTSRPTEARRLLELREFDIVLCEQTFEGSSYTGQALLDDLRRAQLLPFSTVFVMLTSEARYTQVAEAAESALDSYLLKPHTATALSQRLRQARLRKKTLSPIFDAIERGDLPDAARQCLQRFGQRQPYAVYAGRIGAELLLRLGRGTEAKTLYEALQAVHVAPWARLGVARAELQADQTTDALQTLQALAAEHPDFADTFDVLGRLHVEQGQLEQALQAHRRAALLTPGSIVRLQKQGMLAFYLGETEEAARTLDRAALLGLTSKMFDIQTLAVLALARARLRDAQGVRRCLDMLHTAEERQGKAPRLTRLVSLVTALLNLMNQHTELVVAEVSQQARELLEPEFDAEAACNLLSLLAELAHAGKEPMPTPDWINQLGWRFCSTKALTALLMGAAVHHPAYAERVQSAQQRVSDWTQQALSHVIQGQPRTAVKALLTHGAQTRNLRLLEAARLTLVRHRAAITDASDLESLVHEVLSAATPGNQLPPLGQPQGRSAGGLVLRTRNDT